MNRSSAVASLVALAFGVCGAAGCPGPKTPSAEPAEPGAVSPPAPGAEAGAAPAKAPPAPAEAVLLKRDPSVPASGPLPDRTGKIPPREPWDNFVPHEPLTLSFSQPRLAVLMEGYRKDFLGTLLRTGTVDFQLIHTFYREGFVSREDRPGQLAKMLAWIDAQPAAERELYKGHLIVALMHIGFEQEALDLAARWRSEPWFATSWDANAYVGRLLFRWGRYPEAVPFLEAAAGLSDDGWDDIWLRMGLQGVDSPEAEARRDEVFTFGEHVGPDEPALWPFRDRTEAWGFGRWALAGSMAFIDMDNDTFLDLVLTGTYYSPELYRFVPGTGFVREESEPLTTLGNVVPGALAADFDNDGFTDLYLASAAWFGAGINRMLKNDAGKGFIDVSDKGAALADHKSVSSAALDYDRDGLVDIVVSGMKGSPSRLLRNKGGFAFEDVTAAAGINLDPRRFCVHIAAGDVNGDGWQDYFVNCFTDSELYINQGDGTFKNESSARGILPGRAHGFATWMFDYDNDGDLDIVAAVFADLKAEFMGGFGAFPPSHLTRERPDEGVFIPSRLYRNDGEGFFEEIGKEAGLMTLPVMGGQFIDMNLDGNLDIILGPGSHPLHNIQPLFAYLNDGDDHFTNVVPYSTSPNLWGKNHGMAFADIDRDGDPDLYVNNGGVMLSDHWRDVFLENTTTGKHWLHVGVVGTTSNGSAIGARVTVRVPGGRRLMREKAAGQGFGGTNSPYLIFGLDTVDWVEGVEIRWPNGVTQALGPLKADQAIIVTEGSSELRRIY